MEQVPKKTQQRGGGVRHLVNSLAVTVALAAMALLLVGGQELKETLPLPSIMLGGMAVAIFTSKWFRDAVGIKS